MVGSDGIFEHDTRHDGLHDGAKPARADLALDCLFGNCLQRALLKAQET